MLAIYFISSLVMMLVRTYALLHVPLFPFEEGQVVAVGVGEGEFLTAGAG